MNDLEKLENWLVKCMKRKEKEISKGIKCPDDLLSFNRGIQLSFEFTLKKIQEIKSKGSEYEKSGCDKIEETKTYEEDSTTELAPMPNMQQEQRIATI